MIGLASLSLGLSAWSQQPAPTTTLIVKGTVADDLSQPLQGVSITLKGTTTATTTDQAGHYEIEVPADGKLVYTLAGYETKEVNVRGRLRIDVTLESMTELEMVVLMEEEMEEMKAQEEVLYDQAADMAQSPAFRVRGATSTSSLGYATMPATMNREEYAPINESGFVMPQDEPLSTFSIDVDRAAYSNVRRFINQGQMPPNDAVRIEEMVNYFAYEYPQPTGEHPFSITTEIGAAPWAPEHKLLHIGLQGLKIDTEDLPPSNLVFLIDVSGSMSAPNKLGLVKSSMHMLVEQLRPEDRVGMVVYAGAAGVVLESTSGAEKGKILDALERLQAGGSTAGGAGIDLAYSIARKHYMEEGNNRVILCTDGDFNVGTSSTGGLERLIEERRGDGIFLTTLGYGMGNYQDSKMEILADKGNGNYAYIDNAQEAKKVLVNEFGGTLFTIAKDVKLQLEFNPKFVQAYRLIGYENRRLAAEDFNDDTKDAGELGAGHTVTALYEIIPVGVESSFLPNVDELKYQASGSLTPASATDELVTVKFRYKKPDGVRSQLMTHVVTMEGSGDLTNNFRWSSAVAEFGLLLRESTYAQQANFASVLENATAAQSYDPEGYRAEFIRLVESASLMARKD